MKSRNLVFLSYAHEDLKMVRRIFEGLVKRKVDVWFDKEHLRSGLWKTQVLKAINHSRFFIICISNATLRKTGMEKPGFQDEELNTAYNIAINQASTEFTIIPVRIEECDRGDHRLSIYQQYDIFTRPEEELDRLAVLLGGVSLSDSALKDERTKDEKQIQRLAGKAEVAFYAGDYNKAKDNYYAAQNIALEHARNWHNKGVILGELGKYKEEIKAYDKALKFNNNSIDSWINKGIALMDLKRFDEALISCDEALGIDSKNINALNNKGNCLI